MARLLIITRNFPPLTGGMERLCYEAYSALSESYECTVIGPEGGEKFVDEKDRYLACPTSALGFLVKSAFYLLRELKQDYAWVLGGSGIVAPLLGIASLFKKQTALFVHGLDIVAQSRIYQAVFVRSMRSLDLIVANSENTKRLAEEAAVPSQNIQILYPGVSAVEQPPAQDIEAFIKRHNLQGKKLLLSVGRLIERKGMPDFIGNCLAEICSKVPEAHLLVIGEEPEQALKKEQGSIIGQINGLVRSQGLEDKVTLLGRVSSADLNASYALSHAFVFPLVPVPGDVEGFGIVAVEAASFGLPTIAFDEGGVSDAVDDGQTGFLVPSQDYDEYSKRCIEVLRSGMSESMRGYCKLKAQNFSWESYGEKLLNLLKN